jgi:hypothetical protein
MPDPRIQIALEEAGQFRGKPEAASIYAALLIMEEIKALRLAIESLEEKLER